MSKEIDDIFSNKIGESIEKSIKDKRKKLNSKVIIKSIILTLVVVVILNILLGFISKKVIGMRFNERSSTKVLEYMITKPNEYIGQNSYIETGLFKYNSNYEIARKIGNTTVYAGSEHESRSVFNYGQIGYLGFPISEVIPTLDKNIENRRSDVFGLRELCFMMPYVDYENIINDFQYLDEIGEDKYVEMTLSFDKEYSYEEVNNLFDSNLIYFYWIDNDSDETKEHYKDSKFYHDDDTVLGIKSINYAGDYIEDVNERLNIFKGAATNLDGWYKSNVDLDKPMISGIVVVGTASQLKELEGVNIIKHSILGNVVDKF